MKTKSWIILFAALALLCAVLSAVILLPGGHSRAALVYSGGTLVKTLDLSVDGEYRIENGEEWNVISVRGGLVCVASASCTSQDCVHHAPSGSGAPIVCLPNRLVISFSDQAPYDALLQ